MKSLLIVSVAIGLIAVTPAKAQFNYNSLKNVETPSTGKVAKFIEDIEIDRSNFSTPVPKENVKVATYNDNKVNVVTVKSTSKVSIENCTALQFKYAQIMDVEVEVLSNVSLLNFIEEWWGVRYRYGGTTKKGVDCSSLTGNLLRQVYGVELPRTARNQYSICEKLNRDELEVGDLVFFNTRGGVSHVGVYLMNGYFLHSSVHSGVTISSLNESYYSKKYIGGGRPK